MTDALPSWFLALAGGLVGACIGSFLNVCISRWPHELSVVSPPSRCPRCERPIRWHENVPIVSWILLRARCAGCGLPISAQYPFVELLVALLWAACVVRWGAGWTALNVAVFGTVMLGISITDAKHYLIPDGFTVFGLGWVIAASFVGALAGWQTAPFAGPWDAILGACAGAGAIAIIGWLGEVALGREAMGLGDVTLMAVIGGALGAERALLTVFVAAALGSVIFLAVVHPVVRWRRAHGVSAPAVPAGEGAGDAEPMVDPDTGLPHVPFGVFLAPTAVLVLVWGDAIVRTIFRLTIPA